MVNTKLKSDIANIDKRNLYDCNGLSSLTARTMLTGGYHDYLNLFFSDNVSAQHFYHRHQKKSACLLVGSRKTLPTSTTSVCDAKSCWSKDSAKARLFNLVVIK